MGCQRSYSRCSNFNSDYVSANFDFKVIKMVKFLIMTLLTVLFIVVFPILVLWWEVISPRFNQKGEE